MSFTLLCAGNPLTRYLPAFLPTILTLSSVDPMSLRISLVPILVNIASVRKLVSSSLNSNVTYTPLIPVCNQFNAMFIITSDLPDPEPPAKIFNSPRLIPPYRILSICGQPVLTCPPLLKYLLIRPAGSAK